MEESANKVGPCFARHSQKRGMTKVAIVVLIMLLIVVGLIAVKKLGNRQENLVNEDFSLDQDNNSFYGNTTEMNPFGIFYLPKGGELLRDLGAGTRLMKQQYIIYNKSLTPGDESVIKNRNLEWVDTVTTIISDTEDRRVPDGPEVNFVYCMAEDEELEEVKRFVTMIVERYDGDDDFGCNLSAPDCYEAGDGDYPSDELKEAIMERPMHKWQIENEFHYQIKDCSNSSEIVRPSKEKMTEYIIEISKTIRAADDDAVIITPAPTGYHPILLYEQKLDYIEPHTATDCNYKRKYYTENASQETIDYILEIKEWHEYFYREAKDHYDVLDFHYYGNDYYFTEAIVSWVNDLGLGEKGIVMTEVGVPYNFFVLLEAEQPTECVYSGEDIRTPDRYSEALLSESIVKTYVVGLNAGIDAMYWATGVELFDPYKDPFRRLALIYREKSEPITEDLLTNKRKPAYYTYKLMVEKLGGFGSIEEVQEDVYRFSFEHERDVYVAWSQTGEKNISLSEYVNGEVIISYVVVELNGTTPIYPEDKIMNGSSIPLSGAPVFVQDFGEVEAEELEVPGESPGGSSNTGSSSSWNDDDSEQDNVNDSIQVEIIENLTTNESSNLTEGSISTPLRSVMNKKSRQILGSLIVLIAALVIVVFVVLKKRGS